MFCRHFVFRCVCMKTVDFLEKLSSLVMCNSRFLMLCFTKKKKNQLEVAKKKNSLRQALFLGVFMKRNGNAVNHFLLPQRISTNIFVMCYMEICI